MSTTLSKPEEKKLEIDLHESIALSQIVKNTVIVHGSWNDDWYENYHSDMPYGWV